MTTPTTRTLLVLRYLALLAALAFAGTACSGDENGGDTSRSGSANAGDTGTGTAGDHDGHDHDGHDHDGHDHGDTATAAQDPPPSPASQREPDAVVVTVDGAPILERDVREMFDRFVEQQSGGRPIPEAEKARAFEQVRPQIIDRLIAGAIFDAKAEAEGISVTDEEALEAMRHAMRIELVRLGMTQEEMEERVLAGFDGTFEEFLAERANDESFRQFLVHAKLLEKMYPERTEVTEEAIRAEYDEVKAKAFTKPALVEASHILVKVEPSASEEAKTEARGKIDNVLELARAEGADFAALAREHSEGPSGPRGGELGEFPRTGAMVEPFAAAAFELQPGEVSDVVETQFGYHIIKVTGRSDESVVTFEEAREMLEEQLRARKLDEVRAEALEELREQATIERG